MERIRILDLLNMRTIWFVLVAFVMLTESSDAATTYEVGGSIGWRVPPNNSFYNEWAEGKTFRVGDKLSFNWTGTHNVAEVTEQQYENCTIVSSVFGSPLFITLQSLGFHHYICTVDSHCHSGQKLKIEVSSSNSSTPVGSQSPPPPPSSSSSCVLLDALILSATTAILSFFLY